MHADPNKEEFVFLKLHTCQASAVSLVIRAKLLVSFCDARLPSPSDLSPVGKIWVIGQL